MFDFYHFCAKLTENRGTMRGSNKRGDVEDTDAIHGSGFGLSWQRHGLKHSLWIVWTKAVACT
jgi:hypothetical protein